MTALTLYERTINILPGIYATRSGLVSLFSMTTLSHEENNFSKMAENDKFPSVWKKVFHVQSREIRTSDAHLKNKIWM